jgi:diphthamide biosynthesis protein 2
MNIPSLSSFRKDSKKNMLEDLDLGNVIRALRLGNYRRIAVQVHDSHLNVSPDLLKSIQDQLPFTVVSLLGDSVTECCLDEVAAEHYGSDCIVKLGHSCWFASQRLIAYFIGSRSVSPEELRETIVEVYKANPTSAILLFVDSIDDLGRLLTESDALVSRIYVCLSPCLSYPGSNKPQINWFNSRPFSSALIRSFGKFFENKRPEYPRVAGRFVFKWTSTGFTQMLDHREVSLLVDTQSSRFVAIRDDSLYNRLVNRFGTEEGRVLLSSSVDSRGPSSNYKELLRRYRGVEAVKDATVVGIVVTHCAASDELFQVRDILSLFLRAAGKEVHMFSVNKADGCKFGNFPEIDCFIIMACPESEYFESDDLVAACVSPFEALVAMESLDWSDHIITDYDEMLSKMVTEPPPRTPRTPRAKKATEASPETFSASEKKLIPARIEMGLRGIPSRYVSEPGKL